MNKYINNTATQALINGFKGKFGNNSALKTTSKNFVGAINELKLAIANLSQPQPNVDQVAGYPMYDTPVSLASDMPVSEASYNAIRHLANDRLLSYYDGKPHISDDNGATWTVPIFTKSDNTVNYAYSEEDGDIWYFRIYSVPIKLPNNSLITVNDTSTSTYDTFISNDNGSTWAQYTDKLWNIVSTSNMIIGFTCTENGCSYMKISTDGGSTWLTKLTIDNIDSTYSNRLRHMSTFNHDDGSVTIVMRYNSVYISIIISSDANTIYTYTETTSGGTPGDTVIYNNTIYHLSKNSTRCTMIKWNIQTLNSNELDINDATYPTDNLSVNYIHGPGDRLKINDQYIMCYGGFSYTSLYSISTDDGETWSDVLPTITGVDLSNYANILYNGGDIFIVKTNDNIKSCVYENNSWTTYDILKLNDKILTIIDDTNRKGAIYTVQQTNNEQISFMNCYTLITKIDNKLILMNNNPTTNIDTEKIYMFGYKYSTDGKIWHTTGDSSKVFTNVVDLARNYKYMRSYSVVFEQSDYENPYIKYRANIIDSNDYSNYYITDLSN